MRNIKIKLTPLWVCICILLLTMNVIADTLILKNGQTVECKIVAEKDKYIEVEMFGGVVTFHKDEIEKIEKPFEKNGLINGEHDSAHIIYANYLTETNQLYEELKRKYLWAKTNRISPSDEARAFGSLVFDNEIKTTDEAFETLPWGKWSITWGKKVRNLKDEVNSIKTSSPASFKLKKQLLSAIISLIILRSNYESALDGNTAEIDYFINIINEAFNECRKILA